MFTELSVCIKDDEKRLTVKYPLYDIYEVNPLHPIVKDCIEKAVEQFKGVPTDVNIKIKMCVM